MSSFMCDYTGLVWKILCVCITAHMDTAISEVITGFHNDLSEISGKRALEAWMTAKEEENEDEEEEMKEMA